MRAPSSGDFNSLKMSPLYNDVAIAPTCFGGRDEVAADSILKNEMKLIKIPPRATSAMHSAESSNLS